MLRSALAALVFAGAASAAPLCSSDGGASFTRWATFDDVREVRDLVVLDVDLDGRPELVATESTRDRISLFHNDTRDGGTFTRTQLLTSVSPYPAVSRDGALYVGNSDRSVTRYAQLGSTPVRTDLPNLSLDAITGLAVRDLDGDGALDFVTGSLLRFDLAVTREGMTAPWVTFDAGSPMGPAVTADFDSDGRDDAAFTAYASGVVVMLSARDAGPLRFSLYRPATTGVLADLTAMDVDGDTDLDVVQASEGELGVYVNDGQGGFTAARLLGGGTRYVDVAAADFDADGVVDLAASQEGTPGALDVFRATDGGFTRIARITADVEQPLQLVAADFDGDGRVDLAATDYQRFTVSIFRNTTGPCEPGAKADGGTLAGELRWYPVGCGCSSPGGAFALLALLGLRRRRCVRRRHQPGTRARAPCLAPHRRGRSSCDG